MILAVRLPSKEAKALTEICRASVLDAQYLHTGARNVPATSVSEAVMSVPNALNTASRLPVPAESGPIVTAKTEKCHDCPGGRKGRMTLEMPLAMLTPRARGDRSKERQP
jgi:hypothetical protein